jgi:NAD-dependent SIR2 family protein deacetylase
MGFDRGGSKKGSGWGGMTHIHCPRCGGYFKKSYWQKKLNGGLCSNREKCNERLKKVEK